LTHVARDAERASGLIPGATVASLAGLTAVMATPPRPTWCASTPRVSHRHLRVAPAVAMHGLSERPGRMKATPHQIHAGSLTSSRRIDRLAGAFCALGTASVTSRASHGRSSPLIRSARPDTSCRRRNRGRLQRERVRVHKPRPHLDAEVVRRVDAETLVHRRPLTASRTRPLARPLLLRAAE
jgi:hypothetical protein